MVGGRPIREPLAWAGPFVMNTKAEVLAAYEDFQRGAFGHDPRRLLTAERPVQPAETSVPVSRVRAEGRSRSLGGGRTG